MFKVTLQHDIKPEMVDDLFITAAEGASNYWCGFKTHVEPITEENKDEWELVVVDTYEGDNKPIKIKYWDVSNGLARMSSKYPWHMKNFIRGGWDAETADVFMQLCALKEIVYG